VGRGRGNHQSCPDVQPEQYIGGQYSAMSIARPHDVVQPRLLYRLGVGLLKIRKHIRGARVTSAYWRSIVVALFPRVGLVTVNLWPPRPTGFRAGAKKVIAVWPGFGPLQPEGH